MGADVLRTKYHFGAYRADGKVERGGNIGAENSPPHRSRWNCGEGCVGCGSSIMEGEGEGGRNSDRGNNGMTTAAMEYFPPP